VNDVPFVAILVLFLVVFPVAAVAVLYVTRKSHRLHDWHSGADPVVIGGVAAMVVTLFALLLAFGIVTLYDQRQSAKDAVEHEADDLTQIGQDGMVFGERSHLQILQAIHTYACQVTARDFHLMHVGNHVSLFEEIQKDNVKGLFVALRNVKPTSTAQVAFLDSSTRQLNDMVAQRRERIESVGNTLPWPFVFLLIATALVSIVLTAIIKATHGSADSRPSAVDYVLVGCVTFVISAGLLVILLFEFPFSGAFAITQTPFETLAAACT
jgi:hypothetical protein